MKKYVITGFFLFCILAFDKAIESKNKSVVVDSAINKSLALLQKSSHTFLENAALMINCHSCHHQGLGVVTFALAKENGFPVSETVINEAIDSTCSFWERETNTPVFAENDDPAAIVMTANYDLWGLGASHYKNNKMIGLLAKNMMRTQTYNGSWVSVGQRPPLEYYTITATALTIKNIQSFVPVLLQGEMEQRIAKARAWLIQAEPEANEEKTFQLLGLIWCRADKAIIARQAKKLLAAQQEDGGWSQLDSLKTDAYATGQSLYALNQSEQLGVTAPAYQRGIDFLLKTQEADGSWHVKTRTYPFVPYVNSGFPHGNDQFISAAGSNWATLALILAAKHL